MSGLRFAALSLCLVGCSEVRIEDGAGGSAQGPATVSGSTGATDTSASSSSAGGGGGASLPPVVGCEALVPVGDPVVLSGLDLPRFPALVQIDAQSFGLLYLDSDLGEHLLSRVISSPFDAWPPAIGDQVDHVTGDLSNTLGRVTTGPNGAFSASPAMHRGVGVFGQPGFEDWEGQVFLEPGGPGAYSLAYVNAEAGELRYHAQAEPDAYEVVAVFSAADCITNLGFTDSGELLVARRDIGACDNVPATESFLRFSAGALVNGGALETPFMTYQNRLLARTGGAWFVSNGVGSGLDVQGVDGLGSPVGARFVFGGGLEGNAIAFVGSWRAGGFAVAQQAPFDGVVRYDLTVSDGVGLTIAHAVPVPELGDTQNLAIVGATDGRGVLLAYVTLDGIALLRADCHSFEN